MARSSTIGLWLLIGYALSQGIRDVYLAGAFGAIGFFDLVLLAFTGATLFFSTCLFVASPAEFGALRREWRNLLAVNLTTAVAWLCFFGALNLLEPTVVSTVFSGVAPAGVALLALFGLQAAGNVRAGATERLSHMSIVVALVFLAWVVLSGRSGLADVSVGKGLLSLLLAAFSGVTIVAETVFAKRMNDAGISATGVLALRFVLIALIGGVAVFAFGNTELTGVSANDIATTATKILVLMVAPLYLVGKGLALTSPLTTGVVAAFGPTIVFLMQVIEGRIPTSIWVLAATVTYSVFTCTSLFLRATKEK